MRNATSRWLPARMSGGDLLLITWTLIGMALARGSDYAVGNDVIRVGLMVVEMAAPLWVWAAAFISFGLVLTVGVLARIHVVVYIGHWLLGIAYAMLAFAIALSVFQHSPHLDGIRSATVLALPTVLHFVLAARTGSRPISAAASAPVETIRRAE